MLCEQQLTTKAATRPVPKGQTQAELMNDDKVVITHPAVYLALSQSRSSCA